jgi:UDP-N-acetylmuramoyl-tripeptide--D-alanyl-D-alanine ligase
MSALWSAADLLEATGGAMAVPFDADGVSIDTRSLAPGDLFIALRGETGDGHDHVAAAIAKGASGAMVHRLIPGKTRLLLVDDTLAALARLGGFGRSRFAGRVVAITGSVGKTTTKEMLRRILVAVGPTHAAVASHNNHWGLPLTLARLPVDAAFCVAEIGMNHAGEIAPLARLARPHVALITAVERAHIGFLGSIEAIAEEKAAILQGLEPGGIAVLPADNTQFPRLRAAAGKAPMITFGTQHGVDARLIEVATDAAGSDLTASVVGHDVALRLNAPGRHMAMNAVAALAAAAALGLDVPAAAQALSGFSAVAGRGARRLIAMPGGSALLLDESYNGNGASMRAALSVLRLQPASRRIAVLGDMLELGDAGPAEHAALAPDIIAAADLLYACGPLMRLVYDAMPAKLRAAHAPDAATLSEIVARAVAPGDAILVKGSLGSRMKQVVTALDALAEAA